MGTIDVANIYARINIRKNTIKLSFRVRFFKIKKYKIQYSYKATFSWQNKTGPQGHQNFPFSTKAKHKTP
jgi:hypothetical protein